MATVEVPVLKPLTYQGRCYVRGEIVLMEAIDAAVHALRGEVGLDGQTPKPDPPPVGRQARRRYRRRDAE